jgi:hypothetical protein
MSGSRSVLKRGDLQMNPKSMTYSGSVRISPQRTGSVLCDATMAGQTQSCGGVLAVLEVAVATIVVVGTFDALSQPLAWQSVAQFVLCACLAGLLWLADTRRETSEPSSESGAAAYLGQSARHEA